ncbi:HD-GYP domain-containing protein [bacterium]|nr:HD-GYP domain-containing protein [bacterium]MBU1153175.1 HD-GYP domain-containing protein [bacterium]MBU2599916.1 HD-GYP domain-containing protein [bacterium]
MNRFLLADKDEKTRQDLDLTLKEDLKNKLEHHFLEEKDHLYILELLKKREEKARIEEELSLLFNVSKHLTHLYDLSKMYKIVILYLVNQINVKKGLIGTIKEGSKTIDIKSSEGLNNDQLGTAINIKNNSYFNDFILPKILEKRTVLDNQVYRHKDRYFGLAEESVLIVPFRINDREINVLCLFDKIDQVFSAYDLKSVSTVSCLCSISIDKVAHYQELQELFLEVTSALSSAIDTADQYTFGHSSRVAQYAVFIAEKLNFSKEKRDKIYLAGLFHDIGKIGISLEILHKPGNLTAEEFDKVKEHPVKSANILRSIKKLANIIPAIMFHHERFSGGGYPQGLSGEDIPLMARVLCLADAFDAMVSDRPYRKKMSLKEAFSQVEVCSGKQFDPTIAKVFTNFALEVEDLHNSFFSSRDI